MAVLIDPPRWSAHGREWSHLVSDTSLEELHTFAERVGIPRRGFEGDHYDVPQERYAGVVAAGAQEVDGRTLLRALQRSGLRTQKRRHEKVVASFPDAPWLPPGGRADVVASQQDDPPSPTVLVRLAVLADRRLFVVERAGRGLDLPFRVVGDGSVGGTLAALGSAVVGTPGTDPGLVGYVRNIVERPAADYAWPTPRACFAVYAVHLGEPAELGVPGRWVTHDEAGSALSDRHWWPLLRGGLP